MITIYAARDKKTGLLVNDITSPAHRFWEKLGYCEKAVARYNRRADYLRQIGQDPKYDLEVVSIKCLMPEEVKR